MIISFGILISSSSSWVSLLVSSVTAFESRFNFTSFTVTYKIRSGRPPPLG